MNSKPSLSVNCPLCKLSYAVIVGFLKLKYKTAKHIIALNYWIGGPEIGSTEQEEHWLSLDEIELTGKADTSAL